MYARGPIEHAADFVIKVGGTSLDFPRVNPKLPSTKASPAHSTL